jgi:hypothetical protein
VLLEGVSVSSLPGAATAVTAPSSEPVTWASDIQVVGIYDGTTIEVTEPPTEADFGPHSYDFSVPCPPMEWATGPAAERAVAYAQEQDSYATHWVDRWADTFVVAFARDLDVHQVNMTEVAGAPLCVVGADYTRDELTAAQEALATDFRDWEAKGVAIRVGGAVGLGNRVDVLAVWADEGHREEFVRRYGELVVLRSWIAPLEAGSR